MHTAKVNVLYNKKRIQLEIAFCYVSSILRQAQNDINITKSCQSELVEDGFL